MLLKIVKHWLFNHSFINRGAEFLESDWKIRICQFICTPFDEAILRLTQYYYK
ncbi:hypothetical protein L6259_01805 [Candidatus Parcubacteria bacterium]|nr:hypothetical protein [Patescibacteria group bacterium]MCG2693990.1 hypothetical protein [Candidatus Parcubacteria bacterium]